jgi:hypothetical protein
MASLIRSLAGSPNATTGSKSVIAWFHTTTRL